MSEIHILTNQLQLVPALVGGFTFILGLCSMIIKERLYLSETLLATVYGIIVGPRVLNWMDPATWSSDLFQLTQEFSRYALAIEVMIAGICLPQKYLVKEWKSLLMLLLPIMTTMWLVSSAIIKFVFQVPFLHALAIGACAAPTDPVLANAILKGMFAESHVPLRLRNILLAESGANDGLGFPFLFFAIYLIRFDAGQAMGAWFYATWVYQILVSVCIGTASGYIARVALQYAENAGWVDRESFLFSSTTLTLLLVGLCTILGTDDILCCFIAGNSLSWNDWFRIEIEDTGLQETLNTMLSVTFFIYLGAVIPWSEYTAENMLHPWRIVVAVVLVMTLRRLPVLMLSYRLIPAVRTWYDALFAGWFGPIGVSAIFYAIETVKQVNEHDMDAGRVGQIVFPIVAALVFGSVIVHGITIPLVLMGKRVGTTLARTQSVSLPFRGWTRKNRDDSVDIGEPSDAAFSNPEYMKPQT
ncbi:hypothetical protein IWW50_000743 [Coemansia erecta]|nr:hypothetical protein GGF43_000681 [Coemansia sp. RSA 2618]KAJ2829633.1 hypothetical protein IWW50_000743 [Coemansia erecta]